MKTYLIKIALFALVLWLPSQSFAQFNNTPDYWRCSNRTGGTWTFGHAPSACSASTFIGVNYVESKFSPYIFSDSANRTRERDRYMSEMHNLVVEAADYYMKKRKSNVSSRELANWKEAVLAITHQESFMTHYRDGSALRMMRGDFGHGHGLMQIDDRWHFANVSDGNAAHLIKNLFYALDIYYQAWQRAPSTSCVSSATDYYARIRAAYSAYNGGLDDICRFTNPDHRWARNDINFKVKLDSKGWRRHINAVTPTPVNIACLSNTTSQTCSGNTPTPTPVPTPTPTPTPQPGPSQTLYSVGDQIRLDKNINVRETPGGRRLATFNSGESFQVLDRAITNTSTQSRYYLIKKGSVKGYVYAGTKDSYQDWVSDGRGATLYLPVEGSEITILTRSGTNLRATAGGQRLTTVPSGTRLSVLDTEVKGNSKELYVKVRYGSSTGYLYSGLVAPRYTVSDWISIR